MTVPSGQVGDPKRLGNKPKVPGKWTRPASGSVSRPLPTCPSGPQCPRLPCRRPREGGHLPGTTKVAKEPVQAQEAGFRPPSVGPGRCHWSQAVARCPLPACPRRLWRNTPPVRCSAGLAAAPASRGTPGRIVRGRARRPARGGGRTPTPRRPRAAKTALCRRFKGVLLSTPGRLRGSRPNRPPAEAGQTRPTARPGTHRLCKAACPTCRRRFRTE